jgi:hypothetical protein
VIYLAAAIFTLGLLFLATFHAGRMVLLTVAVVIAGGLAVMWKINSDQQYASLEHTNALYSAVAQTCRLAPDVEQKVLFKDDCFKYYYAKMYTDSVWSECGNLDPVTPAQAPTWVSCMSAHVEPYFAPLNAPKWRAQSHPVP